MSERDLHAELQAKYPELYRDVYCGVSIGEGWFNIVDIASSLISSHVKWNNDRRTALLKSNPYDQVIPEELPMPQVAQVKEKFGTLRFYVDREDQYISGIVSMAEAMSARTCETCGEPAVARSGGWIRTLCDRHEAEYQEKKNARS